MQFDRGNRRLYVDGCYATKRTDVTKLPSDEQAAFVTHFQMNFDAALRHCSIEPWPVSKTASHTHPDPNVEAQRAKLRYALG